MYKNPFFFTSVLLFLAAPAVIYSISQHVRIFHFLLFNISESFLYSYILCIPAIFFTKRIRLIYKIIVLILLLLWYLLESGCVLMTGELFSLNSFLLVLETDKREIADFFRYYYSDSLIVLVFASAGCFLLIGFLVKKILGSLQNFIAKFVVAVCILSILFVGILQVFTLSKIIKLRDYEEMILWVGQGSENPDLVNNIRMQFEPLPFKLLFYYKYYIFENSNLNTYIDLQKKVILKDRVGSSNSRDFNIVIVVGESFIRKHSSLYGYGINTNPTLQKELESGHLTVYDSIVTPANMTTPALRNAFNLNSVSEEEEWFEGVYFPILIKKGGWDVYHYDNQVIDTRSDTGISRMFYSDLNLKFLYSGISDSIFKYDGDYVAYTSQKLNSVKTTEKKCVIYHLKGQHFDPLERFNMSPKFFYDDPEYKKLNLNTEQKKDIADYDNATYYNDSILGLIIDEWRSSTTVLLYFSDHGEDMWDLGNVGARNKPMPDDKEWLDRQFHIPFMIWVSDSFSKSYPDIVSKIANSKIKKGTVDDLGHIVLGLTGLTTEYYCPERNILQPEYKALRIKTVYGYEVP